VTWIDGETIIAFDTGPGGALLDDWVRQRAGTAFDRDGALAAAGRRDDGRVAAALRHPYFSRPAPKSLDRDAFTIDLHGLSAEDGAATLVAFTAGAIACACDLMPSRPERWIACGGNRLNATLVDAISQAVGSDVVTAEEVGWDGDAIEAEAFAYLAIRSSMGLALSLPTTTGVSAPATGGALYRAATRA